MTKHNLSIKERFLSHIDIPENPNDCWEWTGSKNNKGYGHYIINHKDYYAHRISFELFVSPIPDKLCVLHACDNPLCCNPSHLFLGTKRDNTADMINKQRNRFIGEKGESHHNHKLTEREVYQIRKMIKQGYTNLKISKMFGVSSATIYDVKHKNTWSWLNDFS